MAAAVSYFFSLPLWAFAVLHCTPAVRLMTVGLFRSFDVWLRQAVRKVRAEAVAGVEKQARIKVRALAWLAPLLACDRPLLIHVLPSLFFSVPVSHDILPFVLLFSCFAMLMFCT